MKRSPSHPPEARSAVVTHPDESHSGHRPPNTLSFHPMSNYRRAQTPGGSYFFTVVTYRRQALLLHPESRHILRQVIRRVRKEYPFVIDAWVLLPEHMHCIWTLPPGDRVFSKRWASSRPNFPRQPRGCYGVKRGSMHRRPSIGKAPCGSGDFGSIKSVTRTISTGMWSISIGTPSNTAT